MTDAWHDAEERSKLDTPLVLIDLDRVRANIERMATLMRDRGVALRPHAKTHKSIEVARRQLAVGPKAERLRTLAARCRLSVGAESVEGVSGWRRRSGVRP